MWFTDLTGLHDDSPEAVRREMRVDGDHLVSKRNGRQLRHGQLEVPSLAELREQSGSTELSGPSFIREVVGDVQDLHANPENANAVFQVASQFNLLEMVGPSVRPEDGVARYADDRTQGPACAMACGGGLLFRNYFVPVGDQIGQSESLQIDCANDLGKALGNQDERLWRMRNGYLLPSRDGLAEIRQTLNAASSDERDGFRSLLRIGLQTDSEVTIRDAGHCVNQVFCSAVPVSYSNCSADDWEPLARLVLEAAYEATLLAARSVSESSDGCVVFLTLLGGGAFGNPTAWIIDAVERALTVVDRTGLDICFVSYGGHQPALERLLDT